MLNFRSVSAAFLAIALLAAFHRTQFLSHMLFHQGESFVQISSTKLSGKFYNNGVASATTFHIRVERVSGNNVVLHVEASDGKGSFITSPLNRYDVSSMSAFFADNTNVTPRLSVLFNSSVWGHLPASIALGDRWQVNQQPSNYFPKGMSTVSVLSLNAKEHSITLGISGSGSGLSGSDIENPSNLESTTHPAGDTSGRKVYKTIETVLSSTWSGKLTLRNGLVQSSDILIKTTIAEPATPISQASHWIRFYAMKSSLVSVSQ